MLALALGLVALAVLVFIGRYGRFWRSARAIVPVILSVLAAAAAVVAAMRGAWVISLALIGLSTWIGVARARRGRGSAIRSSEMRPSEARAILGVGPEANSVEIEAAWRRLMLRAHPDAGGSAGLAAQLNAARACLIKKT
ncbi:MAG TPA: molecular chaperone DnaJ [Caulobacteraceae bacterium]|jgi:hypothetical protein|nr:molecular chaperone DnaJ [Caulobacteraceae bacterium]